MGFVHGHEQSNIIITTTDFDGDHVENNRQQNQQQQVPRWLLDFHHDIHPSLRNNKSRPSTDNNITTTINRPKWFEELCQKRRMSDIADLKYSKNESLFEDVAKNDDSITLSTNHHHDAMTKDHCQQQSINAEDMRKTLNKSLAIIDTHDDDDDDNDNFSFTSATFKSIENLKLDEMTKNIVVEEDCIIPEMPTGIELSLILMENWGDQNFIGLNGIEILDQFGNRPPIENVFLDNDENRRQQNNDLYKLIDNVYRTHDDSHIWQCRFDNHRQSHHNQGNNDGLPVTIVFRFEKPTTIALIRIWNYNKSRIHSYRGVKYAKVKLDEQTIFCGEIAKACGDLTGTLENFGDV
ncbi:hypothetical protein HUG17_5886 [Dermatophagoides farinae]|uniref:KATNIP domain-containing protein n=1 Tax=Dermatophagoides farinae TaxID=6954 RepID=A0A9D4SIA6_DERFA|nr:hypothetical protein HUG17_5886 [Dermatophagoides farinae]